VQASIDALLQEAAGLRTTIIIAHRLEHDPARRRDSCGHGGRVVKPAGSDAAHARLDGANGTGSDKAMVLTQDAGLEARRWGRRRRRARGRRRGGGGDACRQANFKLWFGVQHLPGEERNARR
jgi:hypothetical protein